MTSSSSATSPPFYFDLHVNLHGASIWTDERERSLLWTNEAVLLCILTYNNAEEPDVLLLNALSRILSMMPEEVLIQPRCIRLPSPTPGHQWGLTFQHLHLYLNDMNRPGCFPSEASVSDCTSFLNFAYSGASTTALREAIINSSSSSSFRSDGSELPTNVGLKSSNKKQQESTITTQENEDRGEEKEANLATVFAEQLTKHQIPVGKLQRKPQHDVFCLCLGFSGSFIHALSYLALNKDRGGIKGRSDKDNPIWFHATPDDRSIPSFLLGLIRAGHLKSGSNCVQKPLLSVGAPQARHSPFLRLLDTAGVPLCERSPINATNTSGSNAYFGRSIDPLIQAFLEAKDFEFVVRSPFMLSRFEHIAERFTSLPNSPVMSSFFKAQIPVRSYLEELLDMVKQHTTSNDGTQKRTVISVERIFPNGWQPISVSLTDPIPVQYWKEVGEFLRSRGELQVNLMNLLATAATAAHKAGTAKFTINPTRQANKIFFETILTSEELEKVEFEMRHYYWDHALPRYQSGGERLGEYCPGLNPEFIQHYLKEHTPYDGLLSYFKACPEEGKRREIVREVLKHISFTKGQITYLIERIGDFLDLRVLDEDGRDLLAIIRQLAAGEIARKKERLKMEEEKVPKPSSVDSSIRTLRGDILRAQTLLQNFEKWYEKRQLNHDDSDEEPTMILPHWYYVVVQ